MKAACALSLPVSLPGAEGGRFQILEREGSLLGSLDPCRAPFIVEALKLTHLLVLDGSVLGKLVAADAEALRHVVKTQQQKHVDYLARPARGGPCRKSSEQAVAAEAPAAAAPDTSGRQGDGKGAGGKGAGGKGAEGKDAEGAGGNLSGELDFDRLMASESGLAALLQFAAAEMSDDNLRFLVDARRWRGEAAALPAAPAVEDSDHMASAHALIDAFLKPGAKSAVNLPSQLLQVSFCRLCPCVLLAPLRPSSPPSPPRPPRLSHVRLLLVRPQRYEANDAPEGHAPVPLACSVDMFDDALQEISVIIRGDTFERFSVSTAATTLAAEHAELTVGASKASLDGAAAGGLAVEDIGDTEAHASSSTPPQSQRAGAEVDDVTGAATASSAPAATRDAVPSSQFPMLRLREEITLARQHVAESCAQLAEIERRLRETQQATSATER